MPHAASISLKQSERKRLFDILKRFRNVKILVIGDFILDQFVWGEVNRISPEAPVPVVNVKRESFMPGGALNTANNIRSLGGTVYPCGVVGRDLQGRVLLKVMRREGIDTGGIIYDPDRPTALKTRIIAHSQQVVRFDREKVGDLPEQDLKKILEFVKKRIAVTDAVVIEDYGKGVIQPALLREVVKWAKKYRKPVLVDPKEKHFSYYTGATAITPNRKEAYAAVENILRRTPVSIADAGQSLLKKLKLEAVLVTLGEDGMALFQKKGSEIRIPTSAKEVFDVSGAGDTVIATFSMALAAGAKMREAAIISNTAAGIAVGKLGTATVSWDELAHEIQQLA